MYSYEFSKLENLNFSVSVFSGMFSLIFKYAMSSLTISASCIFWPLVKYLSDGFWESKKSRRIKRVIMTKIAAMIILIAFFLECFIGGGTTICSFFLLSSLFSKIFLSDFTFLLFLNLFFLELLFLEVSFVNNFLSESLFFSVMLLLFLWFFLFFDIQLYIKRS